MPLRRHCRLRAAITDSDGICRSSVRSGRGDSGRIVGYSYPIPVTSGLPVISGARPSAEITSYKQAQQHECGTVLSFRFGRKVITIVVPDLFFRFLMGFTFSLSSPIPAV